MDLLSGKHAFEGFVAVMASPNELWEVELDELVLNHVEMSSLHPTQATMFTILEEKG